MSWGSGVGPWGGFFFGEAEIAHQISGVVFGGLFGDFEDVWIGVTPEEFVSAGSRFISGRGVSKSILWISSKSSLAADFIFFFETRW